MHSLLPLLYLFFIGTKRAETLETTLRFMEYLDQDHLVCLQWGFDNLLGKITFKLIVNTTGWVGFGLSPDGGMKGSDIIMGGHGPSGSYFKDYYSTGNSMPLVDEEQSYTLLSVNVIDDQTIMTFQRPIKSCDYQDFHITAQPIHLIYAYGTTDEIDYHHAYRGSKEVNLLNYMPRNTVTNLNYFSATVDNVTLPSTHTYYHCKVMKFPTLNTKHHIYLVEPVIQHHDIVHHMVLYRCPSNLTQEYDKPCPMGDTQDACFDVVASWAVGIGAYEFPENAGIPVGGEESDTFYGLKIQYNNPNKERGRTDSSGLRLYYRPTQAGQYDVGILFTGLLPFEYLQYYIPPKASQFHTYSVCNTTSFSQLVNPLPDLHVFAVMLQTNLAVSKIRVAHYRNGKQFDFFYIDENYNVEMQQIINLGTIKTIVQGDEIVLECTYNTTKRTNVTKIGLAAADDMCLASLLYYPAISITLCISHPKTKQSVMNTSYQMFGGSSASNQDEISEYEALLKTLPQIQLVADNDSHFSFYQSGAIRDMMKTPTVTCKDISNSDSHTNSDNNNNGLSVRRTSWIVNSLCIMLLQLWNAIM